MSRIIAISGQKGGIGKSTSGIAICKILSEHGRKTLFVDADPQRNSSRHLGANVNIKPDLFDAVFNDVDIRQVIQHTDNGDVIACGRKFYRADLYITFENYPQSDSHDLVYREEPYYLLASKLRELTEYDYIIIDTSPSLSMWLDNCLTAADDIIIPFTADGYSADGLQDLLQTITNIQTVVNPNVKLRGAFFTIHHERTNLATEIYTQMVNEEVGYPIHFFTSKVRASNAMREAQTLKRAFDGKYAKSTSMQDYVEFVKELLSLWNEKL